MVNIVPKIDDDPKLISEKSFMSTDKVLRIANNFQSPKIGTFSNA